MTKVWIGILGISIVMTTLIGIIRKQISDAKAKAKEPIGHYYVLEGDTLLVTDYSFIGGYTFYGGQAVSSDLLPTLKRVK